MARYSLYRLAWFPEKPAIDGALRPRVAPRTALGLQGVFGAGKWSCCLVYVRVPTFLAWPCRRWFPRAVARPTSFPSHREHSLTDPSAGNCAYYSTHAVRPSIPAAVPVSPSTLPSQLRLPSPCPSCVGSPSHLGLSPLASATHRPPDAVCHMSAAALRSLPAALCLPFTSWR